MHPYVTSFWSDFALGQIGASAALLGLIFVSVSINIQIIMPSATLVDRAAESVILLGFVLLGATAVLIPGQGRHAIGTELLVLGLVVTAALFRTLRSAAHSKVRAIEVLVRRVLSLGAPVLAAIAGISLLAGAGGGLVWWVGAVVVAYVAALTGGWVLLVEILR